MLPAVIFAWALVAGRLERFSFTAPLVMVVCGVVLASGTRAVVDVSVDSVLVRDLAEVTLALVLFSDASRVRASVLGGEWSVPARLLGIGLPLTIGLGFLAGLLLFPEVDLWVVAVVAAALAPTDAALGASVMNDRRVPSFIRRTVNVESGLNDGIATPFVLFFLAAAVAGEASDGLGRAVARALVETGLGLVVGVAIGWFGARALARSRQRGWLDTSVTPLGCLALALLSYGVAVGVGGNGFIAAFVGGMAFGNALKHSGEHELGFTEDLASLLAFAVWFVFGALFVAPVLPGVTWQVVAYAVLSLTVVRMVPVGLALLGWGHARRTVVVIGWLGPRGLASIVFGLLAVEELAGSDAQLVSTVVTVTVLASVVLHGLSAGPIAASYLSRPPAEGRPPTHRTFRTRHGHPRPGRPLRARSER